MQYLSKVKVTALLKNASILVFHSIWYEISGIAIAVALACGMAEIVEDRRTGLHFEACNVEDLAAKVEWAWNHPEEMEAMGKEARREYEEKYTTERNYQLLMEIYQRAIEEYSH